MNRYDVKYMQLQEKNIQLILTKQKKVSHTARELGVSRQTMHTWINRYKRYGMPGLLKYKRKRIKPAHNKTPNELEQLVIQLARKSWKYGVTSIADELEYTYNITLHPTTIYRILKRNNVRYTNNQQHTKKRWKKQLYAHKVPGMEMQMDTKYPFGYKQGKVIYTIIDDASRWVYAYAYDTANQENTLNFLEKVYCHTPFPIQKIRTDQGREFIARSVESWFAEHNILHRRNTPYCPEENGKIERFHRTLGEKGIFNHMFPSDSLETIQYKLKLFLNYYNFRKRHCGLGMDGLTPIQKLHECKSVNLTLQCYNI